jgi:hypothetical protein
MHRCPLEKIVMIGIAFPLGNTWGRDGILIQGLNRDGFEYASRMEVEDTDSIMASTKLEPSSPGTDYVFEPCYGWPPSPPLLYNVASLFSSTVKELKFCVS